MYALVFEWSIDHGPLDSIQLCLVLPSSSSSSCTTVHISCSWSLFQAFHGRPVPLWPCLVHCTACLAMLSLLLLSVHVYIHTYNNLYIHILYIRNCNYGLFRRTGTLQGYRLWLRTQSRPHENWRSAFSSYWRLRDCQFPALYLMWYICSHTCTVLWVCSTSIWLCFVVVRMLSFAAHKCTYHFTILIVV